MRERSSLVCDLHRKNRNLARLKIVENLTRQILQRPFSELFQNPGVIGSAELLELGDNRRRDFQCRFISNDAYPSRLAGCAGKHSPRCGLRA